MANNPDYIPPLSNQGDNQNPPAPPVPTPSQIPSPAPLNQDVGIRTMNSDVNSLQQSGGLGSNLGSESKTFRPKDILGNEPLFSPQPQAPQMPPEVQTNGAHNKALMISLISVASLVAIGLLAYFFFFRGTPDGTTPPPISPTDQPPINPAPPTPETPPTTPPVTTEPPAPTTPPFTHTSLFTSSANVLASQVGLTNLNRQSINNAISTSMTSEIRVPILKELLFNLNGQPVSAPELLSAIDPSVSLDNNSRDFEKDFTAFVYKDKDGVWPGYVLGLTDAGAKALTPSSIKVADFPRIFFVTDPGADNTRVFKDGAKPSQAFDFVKYLPYSAPGASFNIGVFNMNGRKYVLMSTSYAGFKEAAKAIGL